MTRAATAALATPAVSAAPRINAQGSLANPNLALDAARAGTLADLPPGPCGRIDARALHDAQASGLTAQVVTIGHVVGPGDPWAMTVADIDAWQRFANDHAQRLLIARSAADLRLAQATGRLAVILGIQNTVMLGEQRDTVASRIHHLAAQGVRVMQLTYNGANALGHGCMSTAVERAPTRADALGLTALGHDAVAQMNEAGVLIDLSHAHADTLRDAVRASTQPIAVTHTGCRALADHPRNLDDADLRRVANSGGVVGVYAMPFLRPSGQPMRDDYLRHLEHALNLIGHEHVGVGTDGTITAVDDVPLYLHHLQAAVAARRAAGVGAAGEDGAVALFLPDHTGPTQFEVLAHRLQQRGHPASVVDAVLGGNWARLLQQVWPAA